jgi:uncharacterized protein (DUF1501 family)
MKETTMSAYSRREFIKKSATTVAVGLAVPPWLARIAWADSPGAATASRARSLVVIQLTGGNDGINTFIPYADAAYRRNRPTLAIAEKEILPLTDSLGLHPSMAAFKGLFDKKQAAIIQGVGYPEPNRSHFRSMEIWQTASPDRLDAEGWVGRYMDEIGKGRVSPLTGINIGSEANEAFLSAHAAVPTIQGLANFGLVFPHSPDGDARTAALRRIQLGENSAGRHSTFFKQVAEETYDTADKIAAGIKNYQPGVTYPKGGLGTGLREIAMLIAADLGTRVFYVSTSGFDTHTGQVRRHAPLLSDLSEGLAAFQQDLEKHGAADRVLTVAFSEFGRRVHENAGGGTDHGTASEMIVVGRPVRGGLYGAYPSLTDLDQGDLKYTTDFRAVYATHIDRWLGAESEHVLGKRLEDLKFV